MSRKKQKEPKFIPGEKIKEIKFDKAQHVFELSLAVMIFATILLTAIISLGALVHKWYVWLICGLVLVYFVVHSTIFIIKTAKTPKYVLYDNCIILNSIWNYRCIKLNSIISVEPIKTIFDKIQREEMNSIVVRYMDNGLKKAILHCVTENIDDVFNEINKAKQVLTEK